MNLEQLIDGYPNIRIATNVDNKKLLDLLDTVSMDLGLFTLRYDRGEDFFAYLNEDKSSKDYVLVFDSKDKKQIDVMLCLSIKEIEIEGKLVKSCYYSDLRSRRRQSDEVRQEWRKLNKDIVNLDIDELKGSVQYCAVLSKNKRALASLLKKDEDTLYEKKVSYHSWNVMGISPLKRFFYRPKFLVRESIKNNNSLESEKSKINFNPSLSKVSHEILKDGNCLATFCLYTSKSRSFVVESATNKMKIVNVLIRLFSGRSISLGQRLDTLYIENIIFKKDLDDSKKIIIIQDILAYIFKNKLNHNVHFINFLEPLRLPKIPGFLAQRVKGFLFQINPKNIDLPPQLPVEDYDLKLNLSRF